MLTLTAIVVTGLLHVPHPVAQQATATCLHAPGTETPDQLDRRRAAVKVARWINTAESRYSASAGTRSYATQDQLTAQTSTDALPDAPGFEVHLDVLDHAYWFEVVDQTDPCGFRFISNQKGLIFTAQPIQ